MVAGAGGGASWKTAGGYAGFEGSSNNPTATGATQTAGYKFGIGQDGYGVGDSDGVAGAGGGYYGGFTSDESDGKEAGSGGSSFISGYEGCNAISEESTEDNIIHTEQSIHYSGKEFSNAIILNGNDDIPENEKNGDGYAIIKLMPDDEKYYSTLYSEI